MHEAPLNINIGPLVSGSYKPQSQDFPAWTEANFTHTQGIQFARRSAVSTDHLSALHPMR